MTKRFQVSSEGGRLQAVVDTPEVGERFPIVIASHAAARDKDGAFFDGLVDPLLRRGLALCRYDPRGYGASEGVAGQMTFWTRWLDLSALTQHLSRELNVERVGLIGADMGAVLSLWWAAVHPVDAVVCLGLPAPKKLGAIPRPVLDRLPIDTSETSVIPHPAQVANALLIYGERDKEAEHAVETAGAMGARFEIAAAADRHLTQLKPRHAAFESAAEWLARHLSRPHHAYGEAEAPEGHEPPRPDVTP